MIKITENLDDNDGDFIVSVSSDLYTTDGVTDGFVLY